MTILLLAGTVLIFIGGVGLVRLPDLLCRTHALSKAVLLGLTLMLIALLFQLGTAYATMKILIIIVFHCVTLPIAGQIFATYAARDN
ncbi:MAG: cation:proton antiporter [Waddliaceae bacterium]|nr:cation:proton antiporter [Waddliaceae bacterium]